MIGNVFGEQFFSAGSLADALSETAGYKAGLALSDEELCDHLSGTNIPILFGKTSCKHMR